MMYNDNPILSNEEYFSLNSHYENNLEPFDRNFYISQIQNLINESMSLCFCLSPGLNNSLKLELENTKNKLLTILENLNLEQNNNLKNFNEFNLFTFLKKLISILNTTKNWLKQEEKEYYKNLALSNLNIILEILNNLFSKLEKINIKIFKYM